MRSRPSALRDFTVDRRVWLLTGVAAAIGAGAAALAVFLLRAIAFATNIFYYHRISLAMVGPAGSTEAPWVMTLVPVIGGIIVGLMAYYGSDKIRGHGIPEAIEAILLNGARVDPKVAVLKPLSAAIAIGSGGPFGAEGPIIMTGGAFGSLVAQWLNLSDAERTTLLVAGAAAGMSATFAAPIAAILLAVELLLFEWRPRSLVPVAVASVLAGALRIRWLGPGPLFPVTLHSTIHLGQSLLVAAPLGIFVGFASAGLSRLMYGFEDGFEHFCGRLHIHWMWWPAIGGIGIGVGGFFFPRGLGVGYDNIAEVLRGNAPVALLLGLIVAKSLDVGVLTQFRDFRRRVGSHLDDWRCDRRGCSAVGAYARRNTGALGTDGNGGHALRRAGCAAHGDSLFSGADPCSAGNTASCIGVYCVLSGDIIDYAAVDPDRKAKPQRVPLIA